MPPSESTDTPTVTTTDVGSLSTGLPVTFLVELFPWIAILLEGQAAPETVTVARILGLINAQLDTSTAVLVAHDRLQAQLDTMRTERDLWREAYVALGESCRHPA